MFVNKNVGKGKALVTSNNEMHSTNGTNGINHINFYFLLLSTN